MNTPIPLHSQPIRRRGRMQSWLRSSFTRNKRDGPLDTSNFDDKSLFSKDSHSDNNSWNAHLRESISFFSREAYYIITPTDSGVDIGPVASTDGLEHTPQNNNNNNTQKKKNVVKKSRQPAKRQSRCAILHKLLGNMKNRRIKKDIMKNHQRQQRGVLCAKLLFNRRAMLRQEKEEEMNECDRKGAESRKHDVPLENDYRFDLSQHVNLFDMCQEEQQE